MNPFILNAIDGLEVAAAALRFAKENMDLLPEEPDGSLEEMGQLGTAVLNLSNALEPLGGTLSLAGAD